MHFMTAAFATAGVLALAASGAPTVPISNAGAALRSQAHNSEHAIAHHYGSGGRAIPLASAAVTELAAHHLERPTVGASFVDKPARLGARSPRPVFSLEPRSEDFNFYPGTHFYAAATMGTRRPHSSGTTVVNNTVYDEYDMQHEFNAIGKAESSTSPKTTSPKKRPGEAGKAGKHVKAGDAGKAVFNVGKAVTLGKPGDVAKMGNVGKAKNVVKPVHIGKPGEMAKPVNFGKPGPAAGSIGKPVKQRRH